MCGMEAMQTSDVIQMYNCVEVSIKGRVHARIHQLIEQRFTLKLLAPRFIRRFL